MEDKIKKEIIETPIIEEAKPKKKRSKAIETIETIFIALILALFIRATVAEARFIPSESMLPTLEIGDRLIVEKISPYFGIPKRGDIIVFYPPAMNEWNSPMGEMNSLFKDKATKEKETSAFRGVVKWLGFTGDVAYIKRVIGLPDETISVTNGQIFINSKPLAEGYIKEQPFYTMEPVKIPSNSIFMMGDNRNNSKDSHVWGPLPVKNIIGHAIVRFWPLNRIGLP